MSNSITQDAEIVIFLSDLKRSIEGKYVGVFDLGGKSFLGIVITTEKQVSLFPLVNIDQIIVKDEGKICKSAKYPTGLPREVANVGVSVE